MPPRENTSIREKTIKQHFSELLISLLQEDISKENVREKVKEKVVKLDSVIKSSKENLEVAIRQNRVLGEIEKEEDKYSKNFKRSEILEVFWYEFREKAKSTMPGLFQPINPSR